MTHIVREPKLIFISSAARNYGSISNFTTILPNDLLTWEDQYEFGELSLVNFTSKMSYYNISFFRNSQFIYNDGSADTTITLPDGNYNVRELATLIQTGLNDSATGIVWTVSINLNTFKYTFTYTGTPTATPVFTAILSSFDILGFETSPKTVGSLTYSDKLVSIGNEPALFIYMNYVIGQNKLIEHPTHSHPSNLENVFAKINIIGTSFFGTITYDQGNYKYLTRVPSSSANIIEISIRDKEGNIIDFSEDYDMILQLEIKQKKVFTLENLGQLMATQLIK